MSETKSDRSEEQSKKLNNDFKFEQMKDAKTPSIIHVIFLNRTLRILLVIGIFCTLLPIVDYFYFYSTEITEFQIDDSGICSHYSIYQIPCGGEDTTETDCIQNACCFSANSGCYHFLPSKYQYTVERNQPWSSSAVLLPTKDVSPLKTKSFQRMKLDIEEINDESLSIFLWNPDDVLIESDPKELSASSKYVYRVYSPETFIEIRRKVDNKTILSSARGPLIASENYFEWSFYLNSITLMGFDELFLREGQRILINNEHSSTVPYVVAFDPETKHYHAVHFETIDSPTEIQILESNVIVIRQFRSSSFKLKLFTGPSFADVRRQIMNHLPHSFSREFWTLGMHFCHSASVYNETEARLEMDHLLSIENLKSIPFDSHCIYDELTALVVSRNDSENVLDDYKAIIEKLKESSKKLVFHISLSVMEESTIDLYQQAFTGELFLSDDDAANFPGIYGGSKKVFYLDYITKSPEITALLESRWLELAQFLNFTDGVFLHKSFPQDDTLNKSMKYLDDFKFKPRNIKSYVQKLIPLNIKLKSGEMLIHQLNNLGRKQIELFQRLNTENKFCITDSYRDDSSCSMLIKEPKPSWVTFQAIVHKSVFYSLIGMSFYGAEVCGSNHGNVQEDLCIRWYQFAIFSPLFYVKSDKTPVKFTKYAQRIMIHTMRTRYSLLNYMRMHLLERKPLLRPLRLEYTDLNTEVENATNGQFMFGESLMIAPVMEQLVVELELMFPETYFEFWSGLEMPKSTTHFSVVMHDIPIFVRAGHIVTLNLANESLSAEDARLQPYILIVALACTERFTCHSQGRLVVEKDLLHYSFVASENHLNITIITPNPKESRTAVCETERLSSSEFLLAKIYGLGEFKEKYRNDYLSLDLNICDDADWNKTFSFLI